MELLHRFSRFMPTTTIVRFGALLRWLDVYNLFLLGLLLGHHVRQLLLHLWLLLGLLLLLLHERWLIQLRRRSDSLQVSQVVLELLGKHLHHLGHHLWHHLSHKSIERLLHHLGVVHHILKHLQLLRLLHLGLVFCIP